MSTMLIQSAVLALVLAAPAAEPVTVSRLDGTIVTGELTAWAPDHVDVESPEGSVSVPLDQLLTIHWERPVTVPTEGTSVLVATLVDGSSLNLTSFEIDGDTAILGTPLSPAEPIRLPRALVVGP